MFADHQAFRPQRLESSCQNRGTLHGCQARILPAKGQGTPIPARYVGEACEGGYRHHDVSDSGQLSLTFFFLDGSGPLIQGWIQPARRPNPMLPSDRGDQANATKHPRPHRP